MGTGCNNVNTAIDGQNNAPNEGSATTLHMSAFLRIELIQLYWTFKSLLQNLH